MSPALPVLPTLQRAFLVLPALVTVLVISAMGEMLAILAVSVRHAQWISTKILFLTQIARNALQIPPQTTLLVLPIAHTASANLDTAGMLMQMMANALLVELLLGSQMQTMSPALPVLPTLQRAFSVLPALVTVSVIPAMREMPAILVVPVRHA